MRIIKLIAENVKRLHAVEITPEGTLITVGGKNGAGKSSVLDSIAYALGGEKLVPSEPIRAGESEAKIVVDLGEFVVTRKFKRTPIRKDEDKAPTADNIIGWSDTISTLTVTNKEGARYPSPQALLDKLLGKLTFDPLAFAEDSKTPEGRKRQTETLRKLVGLDLTPIEDRRKLAMAERAMVKKTRDIKEAQLLAMPYHSGQPAEEIPLADYVRELKQAEEYRRLAEEAQKEVQKAQQTVDIGKRSIEDMVRQKKELEKMLEEMSKRIASAVDKTAADERELEAKQITAQAAYAVIPNIDELHAKLKEMEVTNRKVRENLQHKSAQAALGEEDKRIKSYTEAICAADEAKRFALAAAKFPVVGLGLNDEGVSFNNLPFNQAGTAEQVRVSVAIGIALNPTLKVLLIRNGNLLDEDSLAAVATQAEEAGMQVWMEYVSKSGEGVSVMLVDGEVV